MYLGKKSSIQSRVRPPGMAHAAHASTRLLAAIGLCSAMSAALCFTLRHSAIENAVPLLLIPIVVWVALRFGVLAGVLGTVVSALIFAMYLFPPLHHAAVSDPHQKNSLGWLLLGGIALSGLFGAPRRDR